jgi:hypothetical protein
MSLRKGVKIDGMTWVFALIGMLTSMGDKVTESVKWGDILTPPVVIFALIGFFNGLAANVFTAPKDKPRNPDGE